MKVLFVSLDGVDLFSVAAVARFEKALLAAQGRGTKVKALLICNPHNPLGMYISAAALCALSDELDTWSCC